MSKVLSFSRQNPIFDFSFLRTLTLTNLGNCFCLLEKRKKKSPKHLVLLLHKIFVDGEKHSHFSHIGTTLLPIGVAEVHVGNTEKENLGF